MIHKDEVRFCLIIINVTHVMVKLNSEKPDHPKGVKPLSVRGIWIESEMVDYVMLSFCAQGYIKFWLWEVCLIPWTVT